MPEDDGPFEGDQVNVRGWGKETLDLLKVVVADEAPVGPKTLSVEVENGESRFYGCLVGVHPTPKDVARLAMFSLFGEANIIKNHPRGGRSIEA